MRANILSFDSEIPEIAYLDASFIIHFCVEGTKYHEQCSKFIRRLHKENVPLMISNLTLDEVWYALIKVSLIKNFGDKWYVKLYAEPHIIQEHVPLIRQVMWDISLQQNMILVEVKTEMTLHAIDFIEKYSLLPRDAIHLSTMLGLGVKNIITTDVDFARAEDINVITCNPEILKK